MCNEQSDMCRSMYGSGSTPSLVRVSSSMQMRHLLSVQTEHTSFLPYLATSTSHSYIDRQAVPNLCVVLGAASVVEVVVHAHPQDLHGCSLIHVTESGAVVRAAVKPPAVDYQTRIAERGGGLVHVVGGHELRRVASFRQGWGRG